MIGSTADWLVPSSAARAPVVRLVRRSTSTSSTVAHSGRPQGRAGHGGNRCRAKGVDGVKVGVSKPSRVSPVGATGFRYRCGSALMSVGDGFMIAMAAAPTDTSTATSGDAVLRRRRGKSRAPNFTYDGPVSVIRLQLDVSDSVVRRRVERQWAALFRLRRAVQRDAQHRCRAYWAAHHGRDANTNAVRGRLGLSQRDRGGRQGPYRGQWVDAGSSDQSDRPACGR